LITLKLWSQIYININIWENFFFFHSQNRREIFALPIENSIWKTVFKNRKPTTFINPLRKYFEKSFIFNNFIQENQSLKKKFWRRKKVKNFVYYCSIVQTKHFLIVCGIKSNFSSSMLCFIFYIYFCFIYIINMISVLLSKLIQWTYVSKWCQTV
jgi:hypothetical protein